MKATVLIVLAVVVTVRAVDDLKMCKNGARKPANDDVTIGKCDKPPCILKKRTTVNVEYKFKTDTTITKCENEVYGIISGLPLPFVGVHTTNCCPFIYNLEGEKVGCPIKANEMYLYKNQIKVLPIYPTVSPMVEWGLIDSATSKQFFCFQVSAKIIN